MVRLFTAAFAVVGALFLTSAILYMARATPRHRAAVDLGRWDLPAGVSGGHWTMQSADRDEPRRAKWTRFGETSPHGGAVQVEDIVTGRATWSSENPPAAAGFEREGIASGGGVAADVGADGPPTLLPGERPGWTAEPDDFDSDTHRLVVVTLPCASLEKCRDESRRLAIGKIERYAQEQLGLSQQLATHMGEGWIEQHLLQDADEHVVSADVDGLTHYQVWTRVGVSRRDRAEMRAWQHASEWNARSLRLTAGALAALGCVGLMHLVFSARVSRASRKAGAV